jgi:hypothetical protein
LLKLCGAKTDVSGNVVPRYRYSRHLRHVIYEAVWDIDPMNKRSVTLRREGDRGRWGMVCEIEGARGDWAVRGEAWSDEGVDDCAALAVCRALLSFGDDDGDVMSPDAVVALLERQREGALASAQAFELRVKGHE